MSEKPKTREELAEEYVKNYGDNPREAVCFGYDMGMEAQCLGGLKHLRDEYYRFMESTDAEEFRQWSELYLACVVLIKAIEAMEGEKE